MPLERLKPTGAFVDSEGRLVPLIHRPLGFAFYPYEAAYRQQMALTPQGHLLLAAMPPGRGHGPGPYQPGQGFVSNIPHLAALDLDGGLPYETCAGPELLQGHIFAAPRLAASGDGKYVYLFGMATLERVEGQGNLRMPKTTHAVYRVRLPERGPAEVFFGDPAQPGSDETHLNVPFNVKSQYDPSPELGLATDGRGHLLVSDPGNNRIVVLKEAEAAFAGSFPVPSPGWLGVDPGNGAVYVHSGGDIVKFSGWKDAKEMSRVPLPVVRRQYSHVPSVVSLALDSSAEPAVVWAAWDHRHNNPWVLYRCEDRGDRFGEFEPVAKTAPAPPRHLSADPLRQEVCCVRVDGNEVSILNEASGQVRSVKAAGSLKGLNPFQGPSGNTFHLGRGGKMYRMAYAVPICQYDSTTGQPIPFPAPAAQAAGGGLPGTKRDFGPGRACHGLGVDRRGNIYTIHAAEEKDSAFPIRKISVFSPEGEFQRTVAYIPSDIVRGLLGPRVDPKGNLYIAAGIHPAGRTYPEELEPHVTAANRQAWYGSYLYGSVIKFGPEGGAIWEPTLQGNKWLPAAPPPDIKMPPSLKSEEVVVMGRYGMPGGLLVGAKWWRFGYSPQELPLSGDNTCHCVYSDFDADDFGRVFHPDQGRFRVVVLDTNGNEILHFGSYGNQNYCGPDSYVLDPKERYYRPRRPDDPKDLESPFAQPEIAFGWMTGLAVTDRYAYVADTLNNRVLRAKLDYAAEETVAVP
jgi:hypothetical protein